MQAQLLMHEDVVPVCSHACSRSAAPGAGAAAHQPVAAEALAELPLLQQKRAALRLAPVVLTRWGGCSALRFGWPAV